MNTPIVGITAVIVDSSWIDMLAGLAKSGICKMPPDFCANAVPVRRGATSSPAAKYTRSLRIIGRRPPSAPARGSIRRCGPADVADNARLSLRAGRKFDATRKTARSVDHKAMQIK